MIRKMYKPAVFAALIFTAGCSSFGSGTVTKTPLVDGAGNPVVNRLGMQIYTTTRTSRRAIANQNFQTLAEEVLSHPINLNQPSSCATLPISSVEGMTNTAKKAYFEYLQSCGKNEYTVNIINAVNKVPNTAAGQVMQSYASMVKSQEAAAAQQTASRTRLGGIVAGGYFAADAVDSLVTGFAAGAGSKTVFNGDINASQSSGTSGIGGGGAAGGSSTGGTPQGAGVGPDGPLSPGDNSSLAGAGGPGGAGTGGGPTGSNTLILGSGNIAGLNNNSGRLGASLQGPVGILEPNSHQNAPTNSDQNASPSGAQLGLDDAKTSDDNSLGL